MCFCKYYTETCVFCTILFFVIVQLYICREIVRTYGLWQQIRVDHGTEWALMLFVQSRMSHLRNDTLTLPYLQTPSTQVNE